MAEESIPKGATRADIDVVWCATTTGAIVALPAVTIEQHAARGVRTIAIGDVLLPTSSPDCETPEPAETLTVSQAAALLMRDCPGTSPSSARGRVSYAASRGRFGAVGEGRNRRIDRVSFDAWRLAVRDRDLDKETSR